MEFIKTQIPEIILIKPEIFYDSRGFFTESYNQAKFTANGIPETFVQDNHSHSIQGTLRGLHFQKPPMAQGKLVRVLQGEIFDVGIDIRKNSPTFGKWVGEILSSSNNHMLYIPPGFAHGFYVLSKTADVFYKCTNLYAPELDSGIIWNDPDLNIKWPLLKNIELFLSPKDQKQKTLKELL